MPLGSEIDEIAKSIVKECAGLPLGIITMVGSMRAVDDICEWRDVLKQLRESKIRKDDMENEVFRVLRLSYNLLDDPECQQCFLYCALYPEDYKIHRTELIEYLIAEGIIERMESWREQHDRGHTLLNKLENVCLLEGFSNDDPFYGDSIKKVKMHDLVRDMALQIMKSKGNEVMVSEKSMGYWTEDLVRVSLTDNRLNKNSLNSSPKCPHLLTLLLCKNGYKLQIISDSFFHHMPALKVLDLSFTEIKELPDSISVLTSLTALLLTNCNSLTRMPSLAMLNALEKFDLFRTDSLEVAPEGMEFLLNLRYLNLYGSGLKKLPTGILPRLQHLQILVLEFTQENSEEIIWELSRLQKLEKLFCCFSDVRPYNLYIDRLEDDQQRPSYDYFLVVGYKDMCLDRELLHDNFCEVILNSYPRYVYLGQNKNSTAQIKTKLPRGTQMLDIYGDHGRGFHAEGLKNLTVRGSTMMEFLSDVSSSHFMFQTLEMVHLVFLDNLRLLFRGAPPPTTTSMSLPPKGAFSKLKTFHICHCNKIKKLFSPSLLRNLQNLQRLEVIGCNQVEEIISSEEGERSSSNTNNQSFCVADLPKLKVLVLEGLPELISICNEKLVCKSVEKVDILGCKKLKNIPIPLPLLYLQRLEVCREEWWRSVQWDDSTDKDVLLPFLHFNPYYS